MKKLRQMLDLPPTKILKIAGVALIIILLISIGFRLIGSSFGGSNYSRPTSSHSQAVWIGDDIGMAELHEEGFAGYDGNVNLSVRNVANHSIVIDPPYAGGATGNDAEDFEVTNYNASIETRNSEKTCKAISDLKALEHVIFESANEEDRGCNYTFKVERERVAEVLAVIKDLDPRDLNENTRTIKRTLDDFTSETEILEKKLETIVETLNSAVNAYDTISTLAVSTQDAETLAKIIDSKLGVIERLTRERINITTQLDRLSRAKADQLDRLVYSYFYVHVYENKFVDGTYISDSWKGSIKGAIRDINRSIQDATVHLIVFLFELLKYALYLLLLICVVKYGWKAVKHIWKK